MIFRKLFSGIFFRTLVSQRAGRIDLNARLRKDIFVAEVKSPQRDEKQQNLVHALFLRASRCWRCLYHPAQRLERAHKGARHCLVLMWSLDVSKGMQHCDLWSSISSVLLSWFHTILQLTRQHSPHFNKLKRAISQAVHPAECEISLVYCDKIWGRLRKGQIVAWITQWEP